MGKHPPCQHPSELMGDTFKKMYKKGNDPLAVLLEKSLSKKTNREEKKEIRKN